MVHLRYVHNIQESMSTLRLLVAAVLCCFSTGVAQSQRAAPAVSLARPAWTAADPFTSISSVRVLANGSVIVADLMEKRVQFLAAGGRTARAIGRQGAGPREFASPAAVIALRGDSTLLLDRDQRRFLLLTPAAELLDARVFPESLQQGAEFVRGADAAGRLYFQASGMPVNERSPYVAIKRWDRRSGRIDSVAAVMMPNPKPVSMELSPQMKADGYKGMVVRRIMPFTPEDEWAIAPSGRVAIVRANPYRVDWIESDGSVTRGPALTTPAVPVTDADRKAYDVPNSRIQLTYPATKPAFKEGLVIDPDDNVWVRRETPAGSTVQPWDVFGATGAHRGVVSLPSAKRIVAISKTLVFVARRDADDLQWLEAYAR